MGLKMQNLIPRHINEQKSDNRSIKEGWYATRRNGSLRLGPFLSREQCVVQISQAKDEPGLAIGLAKSKRKRALGPPIE